MMAPSFRSTATINELGEQWLSAHMVALDPACRNDLNRGNLIENMWIRFLVDSMATRTAICGAQ